MRKLRSAAFVLLLVTFTATSAHAAGAAAQDNGRAGRWWPRPTTTTTRPTTTTTTRPPTTTSTTRAPSTTTTTKPPTSGIKALRPGTSWNWQIDGSVDLNILDSARGAQKMLDVDMENTSASTISAIKAKGIVAICYIETGSWESYRSDAGNYPASVLGKTMGGYPDERYVDIRSQAVKDLVVKRLDVAKSKGCDGIEPDIDDSYFEGNNATGFPITYADQVNFNKYIAAAAHARGMSIGLKNGADAQFVNDMQPYTDWALNEQCNQYDECAPYSAFVKAGKAVFQVEYSLSTTQFCPADNAANFDGLKKTESLGATPRTACRNG
jgi:hypothetical protein